MSLPRKKPKLMDELEKSLHLPTDKYKATGVDKEVRNQRKKENKKRDYLIDKQYKQYKMGKKKDNMSNQVFNAIEDIFGRDCKQEYEICIGICSETAQS